MEILKKYSGIILLILVALIAAGGYFLWWPKYLEYENNRKVLENKGREIENKKNYLSEMEAKLNILSDYEQELLKINSAIPIYDVSEVTLFNFIQKISSENGLILQNLTFNPTDYSKQGRVLTSAKWKMKEFSFSVSLRGSYNSLKSFISAVYQNSRMIEINSISFSAPGEKDKSGLYGFDLELIAKYYIEDKIQDISSPYRDELPEI